VLLEKPAIVCLQETKLSVVCNGIANEILGSVFDYVFLPSVGASGGILLGWRRGRLSLTDVSFGQRMLSAKVTTDSQSGCAWWLTVVYGPPQIESEKMAFLAELLQFRSLAVGPWLICGDFNMIYTAQDKNNDRLDRRDKHD
jgi:exonuclease III